MIRPMLMSAVALAGTAVPSQPARAELYGIDELRALCRGETAESPEFRTGAGYRLLAQVARERCRMYLAGLAEGQLDRRERATGARCLPAGTPPEAVADALVEALLAEPEGSGGTVAGLVRDALRTRFGCA